MPELPKSWGLKTQKRTDGKLDIVGKNDAGEEYRVRTTDGDHITQKDVDELHAADRETYSGMGRDQAIRAHIKGLVGEPEDKTVPLIDRAMQFDDPEWIEAAKPVVSAGLGIKTFGSSRAYRNGVERWLETFKGDLC